MKCRLRLFWLILVWFTSLPCVLSGCHGNGNLQLEIQPEGVIKILYGQSLEVFCTTSKFTADDLEFGIFGNSVPSEKVNASTRRLYIKQHKKGVFLYFCRNKVSYHSCYTRVSVDSAPADVTEFSCVSHNLETLNCTWKKSMSYSHTNYSLSYLFESYDGTRMVEGECIANQFCVWTTKFGWRVSRYIQYMKQFIFILKTCNFFGCNEQNFTIDHFSIVKPDSPSRFKVIGNGTHSVLLQWNIPNNMLDFLPQGVDHKIEYQIAKIDNTTYFRKVDTLGLPVKNKTYKFLLSDLPYAHMQYEVRIYIRPKEAVKEEFWSDFTYLVFYTASERPKRPPDSVVGGFDQNPFENKRRIYVYWKQLEEYEEAGANFTYKVVAHQRTGNPKTLLADNKKSLSYVVLEDASLGAINIEIWSTNDIGSSNNKSHLYIPPNTETAALRVPSFTKLAYVNGTYKLSWVGINNIDNYTVFWCQDNTTKICTGRMNFTILEPNKTTHVIDLPKENRYQFAISANNKTKTSGMIWATCDISKDGIAMYGFPVKLDHDVPGKSFVKITWTMACTLQLQDGIVTGYIITYCLVKDTSNVCDSPFSKSTVNISDPKQMAINITDLKPYRTYQFSLALNTTYGLKTIESASTGVTTTEDTPTSPRNVRITEVESNSVVISWDPPLDTNGIITEYAIYNYNAKYDVDHVPDKDNYSLRRRLKLKGLDGFANYSWSVAACNSAIGSCSQRSPPNGIFRRTRIGPPSKLNSVKVIPDKSIKWEKPEKPGGAVDIYQILMIKDGQPKMIFNTTNLSYSLNDCEKGSVDEKYQVRAVNFEEIYLADTIEKHAYKINQKKVLEYKGAWSDSITVDCNSEGFSTTFILMAVFALVSCIIVILYELIKFNRRKKNSTVL